MLFLWNFDLKKCAKFTFKKGKLIYSQSLVIDTIRQIRTCAGTGKNVQVPRV
jgi:hypothetical protein